PCMFNVLPSSDVGLLLQHQVPFNPGLQQIHKNLVLPKACTRHKPIDNTASVKATAQKILPFLIEPRCIVSHLFLTLFRRLVGKYGRLVRAGPGIRGDWDLRFFERVTVVVLAVLLVATLVRYLGNDMDRVAASNATWGSHYLSSSSLPNLVTHT